MNHNTREKIQVARHVGGFIMALAVPAHEPTHCFSCSCYLLPQKARDDVSAMMAVAVRASVGDALREAAPSTEGVQVCTAKAYIPAWRKQTTRIESTGWFAGNERKSKVKR